MVMKLSTSQIQKQILAPAMQQSIEILMLPYMELSQAVNQTLQENPMLEVDEEALRKKQEQDERMKDNMEELARYNESPLVHSMVSDDDMPDQEQLFARQLTLEDEMLRQSRVEFLSPEEIRIAEHIIGNLDQDGFLSAGCDEIAQMAQADPALVEKTLKAIQQFDPAGIAARDLSECLAIQAERLLPAGSTKKLVLDIVQHHIKELGQKKFRELSRNLKAPIERIKDAVNIISHFDPKPARNFRPLEDNLYIQPDIVIRKTGSSEYQLIISDNEIPPLRINQTYKHMLKTGRLKEAEREFIRDKLAQAAYFIKSIQQRGQTIRDIAGVIMEKQKDFFSQGHMALVPMTMKDVAEAIGRNESTVSRAIQNKYMDTPQGTFAMRYFFSQGVGNGHGNGRKVSDEGMVRAHGENGNGNGAVSNRLIKEELKRLVEEEDKSRPLSDQDIEDYFKGKDLQIARRTISKYRRLLNILPSHLRKR